MHGFVDGHVCAYLERLSAADDDVLAEVRRRSQADGVPALDRISARFLRTLTATVQARRILEIGTGYGCSGIQMARELARDGLIFTFELDPGRAAVAREHFALAGVSGSVNVMVGDASRLVHKVAGPFDLIFQDGDTLAYEPMLERLVALLRPGGVLVTDNVLRGGDVVPDSGRGASPHDAAASEARSSYNRRLAEDTRLLTTIVPVGDGIALSVKRSAAAPEVDTR